MPNPFSNVEDAYRNDNGFRAVVDMLESLMHRADITPAEARTAAVYACIRYESRKLTAIKVPFKSGDIDEIYRIENHINQLKRWIDE